MIAALILFAQAPAAPNDLALLRPLIEACWTAQIAAQTRDIHCFTAVFGGAHVRDVHRVEQRGKVVYRGETIYSRSGDAVVFTYFNSLGGSGQGTARPSTDGIDFSLVMRATAASAPADYPSHWRWTANGYDTVSDGGGTVHFTRARRADPAH